MTKITIGVDFIELCGHAPQKVACHGISAISQMTANYLEKCGTAEVVRIDDAYLKIFNIIENDSSVFLIEAFIDALKDIEKEYPGNLMIKFVC